jgi:hypothetical protein
MNLQKHTAQECGTLGIDLYAATSDPLLNLMIRDYMKQGFFESGHPERYNDENVFYVAQYHAQVALEMNIIQEKNCQAAILLGEHGSSTGAPIMEVAASQGAIIVYGDHWPHHLAQAACIADYIMMPEETPAAGAYLSGDATQQSFVVGGDFAKMALIAIGWISVILTLIGGV